ncbi:P-loop containing nucleoside triphosphate hydrolase protein, partial [Boletus edulis]
QGQAIEVVSRRNPHVLVVLPTGGGKSAVYQAPSFSGEGGFRVVFVPYISLMEQVLSDASEKGIPHAVWSSSTSNIDVFHVKLVFVAVEQVAREPFREWLRACFDTGYLNGIVVDEAHDILLSRDYRETFCAFTYLGELGCQIVLLSATLSPSVESVLWRAVGIDAQRQSVLVIRENTARPDIQFLVSRVPEESLQTYAIRILSRHTFHSFADRGIVYCETVEDATVLSNLIQAPFYIGPMDAEARSASVSRWLSGQSRWLCATSAFAQGIDYSHVTYVLHYRVPKHITLYAQQSGRLARRDG